MSRFWEPEFEFEHRKDGTILMRQVGALEDYLPTLADYLDHWAHTAPDRPWLARRDDAGAWQAISYGDARDQALRLGAGLLELGLSPERPLLILSENSLEHGILGLACAYVGIPYAPVSPAYSLVSKDHAKLRDVANVIQPGAIFADDGAAFSDACAAIAKDDCRVINHRNPIAGALLFDELANASVEAAQVARARLTKEHVVKYLFTSGSTGSPKAVINTNGMVCAMAAMVRDCYRFLQDEPPVVLDWAPWNHTASGNKVSYLVLTNGGTYYIDDGRPVPGKFDETLRNLREIACTWYFNVPVGFDMLLEELERDDALAETFFSRLSLLFYAGAGMAQHTWDGIKAASRRATGHEVLLTTGLGATETAPFALACTVPQEKSGNIGVPARGLTLKLVPTGGKLEARLKGPSITPGYLGDPVKTAEVFDDEGFYCLGDALRPADPNDFSAGFFFDGRVAENFKLTTGTWVAVGAVRASLVDGFGGLIRDAVIVGENQTELGALVLLSERASRMNQQELRAALKEKLVSCAGSASGSASRVRRIAVLEAQPSFDKGEVTEKGSLNQRAMRANNAELIDQLYAGSAAAISV